MADFPTLCLRALESLDRTVGEIGEGQWDLPTPCTDWSVRDLVNHLTAEALWAPHLLRGETLEQVGDRYDGDVVGPDPQASWVQASAGERVALAASDTHADPVHTSMGPVPTDEYLGQLLTDLLVHRWDLARAIGTDETLDPEAARVLCDKWGPHADTLASTGVFAERVAVAEHADAAVRLLGMLGRNP